MKILLLYTPRAGSTSILKYFQKLKPEYECFNEPWFDWMIQHIHKNKTEYSELITRENIFVKSAYRTLPVSLETLLKDFDRVIILLRKNQKEQVESAILAHKEENFLDYTPRKYNVYNITNSELKEISDRYNFLNETLVRFAKTNSLPVFYYEDLYYGDFTALFKQIGVEYDQECYREFLDVSNKYRIGDNEIKIKTSLI